jgi:hypothetical protein
MPAVTDPRIIRGFNSGIAMENGETKRPWVVSNERERPWLVSEGETKHPWVVTLDDEDVHISIEQDGNGRPRAVHLSHTMSGSGDELVGARCCTGCSRSRTRRKGRL